MSPDLGSGRGSGVSGMCPLPIYPIPLSGPNSPALRVGIGGGGSMCPLSKLGALEGSYGSRDICTAPAWCQAGSGVGWVATTFLSSTVCLRLPTPREPSYQ